VRDGDPGALAALARVRGAAVLAFCEQLCDPATAIVATTDAFARFRAAVYTAPRLDAIEPDALLLQRTREAAAEHALPAPAATSVRERMAKRRSSTCAHVPMLLAARASGELSDADRERLQRHLSRCSACRVIEARFQQAERAYRDARPEALPPAVAASIVDALSAAAPLSDEAAVATAPSDEVEQAAPVQVPFVAPDDPQPDYGEAPTDLLPVVHAPAIERAAVTEHVEAPQVIVPPPVVEPEPAAAPAPAAEPEPVYTPEPAEPELGLSELATHAEYEQPEVGYDEPPATAVFGEAAGAPLRQEPGTIAFAAGAARRARGALLRPGALRRRTTRPDPAFRQHRRGGFATRIVAPAAIVLGALVAALAVAGVFNSKSHIVRRAATTNLTPPAAALVPQPAAKKAHKHRHRHHRRSQPAVAAAPRPTATTPATAPTATTPPQQVATVAPAPRPTTTHPSAPPATAHVIGGPTSQAPPQTGAPAGTGPSGYQPSTP
jgi:anti-sigma factor RsiW